MGTVEPIAIVGIGCRFPGADGPNAFWRLLADGVDAIREVPPERWSLEEFYDDDPAAPGKMNTRWGGFLRDVDRFDAAFFGIAPREAAHMDPQQRLLMEVAWEALEDAGIPVDTLRGKPVGVFVGMSSFDYGAQQLAQLEHIRDGYINTGSALSIGANRISYFFDFRGPSLTIDTACSSSLVATYYACQSLSRGESRVALAGGVTLILSPGPTIGFSKLQAMAPDGRCKAFDARADGFVRGEGAGVVVLKSLATAVADGDRIYAVIRGGAVNQDGRTNGLTAPNGLSQEALLRATLSSAGVRSSEIQYVEAHGTGTALGDPIELDALGATLAPGRSREARCAVGSVKTNIGHLEAAAGVAGLVKLALSLERHQLPPSLHFEKPNPHVRFEALPLRVVTRLEPWPASADPARGVVSAFSFGGTNAQLLLEEPPARAPRAQTHRGDAWILPISARSEEALSSLVRAHVERLADGNAEPGLVDVCATAAIRRSHHEYRVAALASSRAEMASALAAFLEGEHPPEVYGGHRVAGRRRKTVFVFPGHGSQWLGMGRELVAREPVFAAAVQRCADAFAEHVEWSLIEELEASPEKSRLDEEDILQPAIFAIEVALYELWRSWGVMPDAVVGHSMGEVAAAHVSGALSLADAARVICLRSRLARRMSGRGAMAVVELSLERSSELLAGYEGRLSVAVSNSPTSTALSGDLDALDEVVAGLERDGVFCRRVKIDYASHSPHMDPLRDDLFSMLDGITPRATAVPLYSTLNTAITPGAELGREYWVRNLRDPVLFAGTVERLLDDRYHVFLEVSPHSILLPAIQQCLFGLKKDGVLLGSLRRGADERRSLLSTAARLYAAGQSIEWSRLYPPEVERVPLPAYPWQRQRFWFDDDREQPTQPRNLEALDPPSGAHVRATTASGSHVRRREPVASAQDSSRDAPEITLAGLTPLRQPVPGFSWVRSLLGREPTTSVDDARDELRKVLFGSIDFLRVQRVLDYGGGADAMALGVGHPEIRVDALAETLEASLSGNQDVLSLGLGDRVRFFHRDPSSAALPEQYELACRLAPSDRFEVQAALMQNVATHLGSGGVLIESAFVATETEANGIAARSEDEWAELLSRSGLRLLEVLDGTCEIANFFDAPDFENDLASVRREGELGEDVVRKLRSLRPLGVSLRQRGLRYCWLIAQKDPYLRQDALCRLNLQRLKAPAFYGDRLAAEAFDDGEPYYEVNWVPDGSSGPESSVDGRVPAGSQWVVFVDSLGFGSELVRVLSSRGVRVLTVHPGEKYERIGEDAYRVRPGDRDDLRALLEDLLVDPAASLLGAIHLWSLDAARPEQTTRASLDQAQRLSSLTVVSWVQEAARRKWRTGAPRLWVVTGPTQPIAGAETTVAVAQTPVWGLGRAVAQEHPSLWGGLIAVDSVAPEAAAERIGGRILSAGGEDQLTIRPEATYVARLRRLTKSEGDDRAIVVRPDAAYLITGGLGDLGLCVARWLVEKGARRLILLSRTKLPPRSSWSQLEEVSRLHEQTEAILNMESAGATVETVASDVADASQLEAVLEDWNQRGEPVRGVVHAAGFAGLRSIEDLDAGAWNATMKAKVAGGWLLHELFTERPLDFMVFFSSVSSLLGVLGQGLAHYAAANAFLDALAHYRRSLGLPAISIDWGPWAQLGMAARSDQLERLASFGVTGIAPDRGLRHLEALMSGGRAQVAVLDVDWAQLGRVGTAARSPLLSGLMPRNVTDRARSAEVPLTAEAILAAAPELRLGLLESALREKVATVLRLFPADIDLHQPLTELGLDSLMGVELKNTVESELGVSVPLGELLHDASVSDLSAVLLDGLSDTNPPALEMQAPDSVQRDGETRDSLLLSFLALGKNDEK